MAQPRWVDDDRVDSQAMLSAYMGWASQASDAEIRDTVPHLYTVDHVPLVAPAVTIRGIAMPSRLCSAPSCARCLAQRGGYQFRWFDRRWMHTYEEVRRDGSLSFAQ